MNAAQKKLAIIKAKVKQLEDDMMEMYLLAPAFIAKLLQTGESSNLEAFHSSIYSRRILSKADNPQTTTQKCNAGLAIASLIYNNKEAALPLLLESVSAWKVNEIAMNRIRKTYESNRKWAKERKKKNDEMKAKKIAGQAQYLTTAVGRRKAETGTYMNSTKSENSKVKKIMKKLK